MSATDGRAGADLPVLGPFARNLGVVLDGGSATHASGSLALDERHLNRAGIVHGGVLMTLADTLAGAICHLALGGSTGSTTLEAKINFLRPVRVGDQLHATARFLHRGRRSLVCEITVRTPDDRLVAVMIQTQLVQSSQTSEHNDS